MQDLFASTKYTDHDTVAISRQNLSGKKSALPKVPSRKDFLKVIEETSTATELVDEFRSRFAMRQQIKEEEKKKNKSTPPTTTSLTSQLHPLSSGGGDDLDQHQHLYKYNHYNHHNQ